VLHSFAVLSFCEALWEKAEESYGLRAAEELLPAALLRRGREMQAQSTSKLQGHRRAVGAGLARAVGRKRLFFFFSGAFREDPPSLGLSETRLSFTEKEAPGALSARHGSSWLWHGAPWRGGPRSKPCEAFKKIPRARPSSLREVLRCGPAPKHTLESETAKLRQLQSSEV